MTIAIGEQPPALSLPTLDLGEYRIGRNGTKGTLLVFYRGLHCPLCIRQLGEIEERLSEFEALGIEVVAISSDHETKARQTAEKAGVDKLTIAHSMPIAEAAVNWGLWVSSARAGSDEPDYFFEPGIFYVTPDRGTYFAWTQSAPFARPKIEDILSAIRFQQEKDYPPRGMYRGEYAEAAA